jgi:hypothetical protein
MAGHRWLHFGSMSFEQHLRRLNEQYVAASLAGDVEWYRSHLAEDFVCIDSDGSVRRVESGVRPDYASGEGAGLVKSGRRAARIPRQVS